MNRYWIRYLPFDVRRRLVDRIELQKAIENVAWLFFDNLFRLGCTFGVLVWLARHLGPADFGLYNYALAFVGLFGAIAGVGMDGVIVRELVQHPERKLAIMGSAFVIKLVGACAAMIGCALAIYLVNPSPEDMPARWMVCIVAFHYIARSFDVVDFWFQSEVSSRHAVIAKNIGTAVANIMRVIVILLNLPLTALAYIYVAEFAMIAIFLVHVYSRQGHRIREWKVERDIIRQLLSDTWPLMLASLAVVVYMRVDQVMIGKFLDDQQLGLYAAAVRISEIWYFVPVAILPSVYPAILKARVISASLYQEQLRTLYSLLAAAGWAVALVTTIAASLMMRTIFGPDYLPAAPVLALHIWAGIFVALGVASGYYLLAENMSQLLVVRSGVALLVNIVLNVIFIPKVGIIAPAIVTLITHILVAFAIAYDKRYQTQCIILLRATLFLDLIPVIKRHWLERRN